MMCGFPDAEAQIQWWQDVNENAQRIFSELRLQLGYDNSIVGLCDESCICVSEGFDLCHCTPDLEPWTIERIIHDGSSATPTTRLGLVCFRLTGGLVVLLYERLALPIYS